MTSINEQLFGYIKQDNLVGIKYLVSLGADIRTKNDYGVKYASEYGHLEVVKYPDINEISNNKLKIFEIRDSYRQQRD